ncbi:MAG: TolC family protein [Acidobacteriota bacterium]
MRLVPLILTFSAAAFAQDTLRLSLSRAVDIALTSEGSARIALAAQSIDRAQAQVAQAKAAFLPNIDGGTQARSQTTNLRTFGFNFDFPGFTFPNVVGPFTVVDARAQAKWNVLDFTTLRKYRAAKGGVDSSKADLEVTRTQVSDQVARAYLTVLRSDAAVEAAQANLELSQGLLDLAQSQKDAGTGTGIEVTRAQVQLANDSGRLIVVRNDRSRASLQLLRAMGLELSLAVQLTDKLIYMPVDTVGIETSLNEARKSRAEMKAQKQREEVARLNYSAIEAERLPSVSTFGDYGAIGQPKIGLEPTHTVGVNVAIPIFDGGRRRVRRQESTSQILTEEIRTRDLEQQIELEVRLAIESLRSADSQVATARDGLALAQNEVEQARRRYQAGVSVPLEITDAQTRLDRARDNQIVALYSYNLARLDLAAATGHIQEFVHP